jgi:RNA polymerase sigma-70 factor, ECF subfamily
MVFMVMSFLEGCCCRTADRLRTWDEAGSPLVPGRTPDAFFMTLPLPTMSLTVSGTNDVTGDDEEQDVIRAQAGDVRAFERLIATHVEKIRRFARAFAHSDADADDLAQEALIKVYRSIRSYRLEAAFSTWLYAVVRNAFLDIQKSRAGRERASERPIERTDGETAAAEMPLPDELLSQAQERRRLWDAIGSISAQFRTALVLFDVEGLSYEEIAAIERIPLGTVKSRLKRGRDQLRRLLQQRGPETGTPDAAASSYPERSLGG